MKPLTAYRGKGGGVAFSKSEGYADLPLSLPCGQCVGCRLAKAREWAVRCAHEAQMHDESCFLTLTYSPEHLPEDGSLQMSDWQKFAKRVRNEKGPFRFLMCGEYGDKNQRPHYHVCMFGHDFREDRRLVQERGASRLYASPLLERLWGLGYATVGLLTYQSAKYVARYCMKKVNGESAEKRYGRIDVETGECFEVRPEFLNMSRRPGLGSSWYDKFKGDVYPEDVLVHGGQKMRPPKFYDKLLEKDAPDDLVELKLKRSRYAQTRVTKYTPDRLYAKSHILLAGEKNLERKL